jgi:hypothetical protein
MSVEQTLVSQFDRMVRRDGGSVSWIGVEGSCITVGYRPGTAPECSEGVCIMPHMELQQMMAETLGRRDPTMSVRVLLLETPLAQ